MIHFYPINIVYSPQEIYFLTRCLDSGVFLDMFVLFMKREVRILGRNVNYVNISLTIPQLEFK